MADNTIGGLQILATETVFRYNDGISKNSFDEYPNVNYPNANNDGPYTVLGPVMLPQIYGKDLNAIEIGSSGIIALSIYDSNVLAINESTNTVNDENEFNMIQIDTHRDTDAIQLRSGSNVNKVVLDSLMVSENDTQNILSTTKTDGLRLNDMVAINGTLSVDETVTFSSNLSVGEEVVFESSLSVGGEVTLCNNTFVEGKILKIPVGSNADRPVQAEGAPYGSIFLNLEEKKFQGLHEDGIWRGLGGVIDTDSDTFILAEADSTPEGDTDTLYFHADDSNVARMIMDASNLSIALDVQITDTLSVGDDVVFSSNLSVADTVTLSSTLSVAGRASFCNHTYIDGKTFKLPAGMASERPTWDSYAPSNTDGLITTALLSDNPLTNEATGEAPMGSFFYNTEDDKFQGLHRDGVWRNMGGVVDTDGDTKILAEIGDDNDQLHFFADESNIPRMIMSDSNLSIALDVQITDTLSVGDSVIFSSNLSVEGPVDMNNTLTVTSGTFMKSTLSVEAATHLNNSLYVAQATTLNSTLSVTSAVGLGSTLSVNGVTNFKDDVFLGSNLSVNDATTLSSTLSVGGSSMFTGATFMESTLSVEDSADFQSNVQIGLTLSVSDDVTFSSNLSVSDTVTFSDTLSVANAVVFKNTLSVGSATTLNNILSVSGNTTLRSELSVGAKTVLANTLSVGNDLTINNGNTLVTDHITTNGSDLTITLGSDSTGTLRVNGDLEILGTLNQINTTVSNIQVTDKTITLAVGEDDVAGGAQNIHEDSRSNNDKSGIKVEGKPTGISDDNSYFIGTFDSSDAIDVDNIYEKSILWNLSDSINDDSGLRYMGGLNTFEALPKNNLAQMERESFWEVKGGSLRITSLFKNASDLVDKISYGFRISRNKQLQIVKYEWKTSRDPTSQVVSTEKILPKVLQTMGVSFN